MRVPEPHMGRAARNCFAVSLVSRACHPVRCTHFPDWSDTDQTEDMDAHDSSGDHVVLRSSTRDISHDCDFQSARASRFTNRHCLVHSYTVNEIYDTNDTSQSYGL